MAEPGRIPTPMIETHALRRTFKVRGGSVDAVKGVDLRVEAGEIFGFLGPNGAGKTTTLRMLATLLSPTGGEATIAGADLRTEAQLVRQRIGYVPQGGSTDPAETGRGELIIQGRLYGMSKSDAVARAAEVLAKLDLEPAADRPTTTYSGGMRRRLDVGLGIVHRPQVLFLDEPTTGLDPQARARMWDEIRGLRALGTTVFMTTHYLEEADALCDRILVIDHGGSSRRALRRSSSAGSPATPSSSRSATTNTRASRPTSSTGRRTAPWSGFTYRAPSTGSRACSARWTTQASCRSASRSTGPRSTTCSCP
jgi:ABC-type multidrug transport system ATPase subunit